MDIFIGFCLFVVGAAMGSFAMAQVWRLRARQVGSVGKLRREKKAKLSEWRTDRSICLHCGYQLRWFDNIPILSWLFLRGRCRKCEVRIGAAEILMEVFVGAAFVLSYFFWPEMVEGGFSTWWGVALLIVFLAMITGMSMLFVYDSKWGRLPERVLIFCVVCGIIFASLRTGWLFAVSQIPIGEAWGSILSMAGVLVILPGLYFVLYKVSGERMVGSGDYLLAVPIALVLGDWWLGFWCLFISNALGCLVMVPMAIRGKKIKEDMHVKFGPFLILGFLIVFFVQEFLMSLI